jgi:hypothetical protein
LKLAAGLDLLPRNLAGRGEAENESSLHGYVVIHPTHEDSIALLRQRGVTGKREIMKRLALLWLLLLSACAA